MTEVINNNEQQQIPPYLLEPIFDHPRSPNRAHAMALMNVFIGEQIIPEVAQATIAPLGDKTPQLEQTIQEWNDSAQQGSNEDIQIDTINKLRLNICNSLAENHAEGYLLHRELFKQVKTLYLKRHEKEFDKLRETAVHKLIKY